MRTKGAVMSTRGNEPASGSAVCDNSQRSSHIRSSPHGLLSTTRQLFRQFPPQPPTDQLRNSGGSTNGFGETVASLIVRSSHSIRRRTHVEYGRAIVLNENDGSHKQRRILENLEVGGAILLEFALEETEGITQLTVVLAARSGRRYGCGGRGEKRARAPGSGVTPLD